MGAVVASPAGALERRPRSFAVALGAIAGPADWGAWSDGDNEAFGGRPLPRPTSQTRSAAQSMMPRCDRFKYLEPKV